tara:strand:+ start:3052 stop:3483 length:432 start_codon:yes stop_codon:yes gene_type:complete
MTNDEEKRNVRVVKVEDLATTVKLKRVQANADERKAKDKQRHDAEVRKAEARAAEMQAKLELQRMKLSMSAREAASRHLAHFAGLYMFLCVIAFLVAVRTLEPELVAVVAGLITLTVTTIGGLLRSIVSEGGSVEEKKPEEPK